MRHLSKKYDVKAMLPHFFYQERHCGHYRQKHTVSISLFGTYQSGVLCTNGLLTHKQE